MNSSFTFPEKVMSDITKEEKLIDDIKLVIALYRAENCL